MNLVTQMVRDLESDHSSTEKEKKGELPLFAAANLLYGKNHQPTAKRARLIVVVSLLLAMALLFVDRVLLPQHYQWKLSDKNEIKNLGGSETLMQDMFETLDLYIDEPEIKKSDRKSSESEHLNKAILHTDNVNEINSILPMEKPLSSVAVLKEQESRVIKDQVREGNKRRTIINEKTVSQTATELTPKMIPEISILKVKRPLNQESSDIRDYENAMALLSDKGAITAIDYLSQHQAKTDAEIKRRRFYKSVILYASLLVENQRYSAAESLLKKYQTAHPANQDFSKLRIRSALTQYDYQQALVLLDEFSLPINEDAEFTEMRAVTQQAQSRYMEAADNYKQLLQFDNRPARWWMGLAVAFDGLADFQHAEQAYQQVLLSTDLSTEHNAYALRRINDLTRL